MANGRFVFPFLLTGAMSTASHGGMEGSLAMFAGKIEKAFFALEPYPLASRELAGVTVEEAYEIQGRLLNRMAAKGEVVAGYKAGVMTEEARTKFGLNEGVRGTLFESMLLEPGRLNRREFFRMFIETEIGFRLGEDILAPVDDLETLKRAVVEVFPALELPDMAFSEMKGLMGTDLIAANVAARKVMIGRASEAEDLNAVAVRLLHDGREVARGEGHYALGDQWEALKWTVNHVLAGGGEMRRGYIVITGVISKMVEAEPGFYVADYGHFGRIEFEYT